MKLTIAQKVALMDALKNPQGLVSFSRRNDAGMDALVGAGLAMEDDAYMGPLIRGQMLARMKELAAGLHDALSRNAHSLETVELDSMELAQAARDLQRKRHYLTEQGRTVAEELVYEADRARANLVERRYHP